MDHNENMEWEANVPAFDYSAEMKKIRKSLRKRNFLIVLTSLVLVAALTFGTIQYGIPFLEKQYWDPNTSTYVEGVTDLALTMITYNELFAYGQQLMTVDVDKTGFAEYDIELGFLNWKNLHHLTDASYRQATLDRGELTFPSEFWGNTPSRSPIKNNTRPSSLAEYENSYTRKALNKYPEYVEVMATITFSEDLTMEQLLKLIEKHEGLDARFIWAYIRNNAPQDDFIKPCGIHLYDYLGYTSDIYNSEIWAEAGYPNLISPAGYSSIVYPGESITGDTMEQHFKSLLKFSNDQLTKGTGIIAPNGDENYYQNVLDYVEENGVETYGCIMIATPQILLNLMDYDIIYSVTLSDAWIGF